MRAYHFVGETLRDGRPVPKDGEWLVHEGDIVICESGFHASRHPLDALQYAPGSTLCLVNLVGELQYQEDKIVGRKRQIIKRIDATDILREFARWCALSVVHLWAAPEIVIEYLKTGNEEIRDAARAAAWNAKDASRATARTAAWAASDASRAASMAASRAAGDATWAVRDAAWAARAVAINSQRRKFSKLVCTAMKKG